jgi:chaperonin GroES
MPKKLRPLYEMLLCEELHEESETKLASGVVVPDVSAMAFKRYKVVETGAGRPILDGKLLPLQVKKGEVVLVRSQAKVEAVKYQGFTLSLVREADVIAIEDEC